MRHILRNSFPALLALILAGAPALNAQTVPSPFRFIEGRQEAGPVFGVVDAATGRFGYAPNGGLMLGGRYALELSGPVALEGVATLISGERDIVNPRRVEGDRVVGQADARVATVDARFRFSLMGDRMWHRISPFIVAGGGVAFDLAESAQVEETLRPEDRFEFGTSFYGTTGLGTRWFVTDRFALRVDGTFSLWKVGTPTGFDEIGAENVEEGEWLQSLGLTISTLIRW